MKKLNFLLPAFFLILLYVSACNKSGNNYSTTDHTVGIAGVVKHWSGTSWGYAKGDTTSGTINTEWPKAFNRTITDTVFAVQKVNGFEIGVLGAYMNYLSTDSMAGLVKFDTTLSGSALSYLDFWYAKDSAYVEYHDVSGYNATANQYYQVNTYLHTN